MRLAPLVSVWLHLGISGLLLASLTACQSASEGEDASLPDGVVQFDSGLPGDDASAGLDATSSVDAEVAADAGPNPGACPEGATWHPPVELSEHSMYWFSSADSKGNALAYGNGVLERHMGQGEWAPVTLSAEFEALLESFRGVTLEDGILLIAETPQVDTLRLHHLRARDRIEVTVPEVTIPEPTAESRLGAKGGPTVRLGSNGHVVLVRQELAAVFDPVTQLWSEWTTLWTAATPENRLDVVAAAVGDDGSAMVVYVEWGRASAAGAYGWSYTSRRFDPSTGWGESQGIASGRWDVTDNSSRPNARAPGAGRYPQLRLDGDGNALFLWVEERAQIGTCSGGSCSYYEVPNAVRAARFSRAADAWVSTVDLVGDTSWPTSVTVMETNDVIAIFAYNPRVYEPQTCGPLQYRVLRAATGLWDPVLSVPSSQHCLLDDGVGVATEEGQLTAISVPRQGAPGLYGHRKLDENSPWTSMVQLDPTLGPAPGGVRVLALGPCEAVALWRLGGERALRAHFY